MTDGPLVTHLSIFGFVSTLRLSIRKRKVADAAESPWGPRKPLRCLDPQTGLCFSRQSLSQTSKPILQLQSQDCRHPYLRGTRAQIPGQRLDVDSPECSPVLSCTVTIAKQNKVT